MNNKIPKLSVCIITYNHVDFIEECIESILPQVAGFESEIIIGDDHSSDGTREILQQYRDKYPRLIKLILQTDNTGGTKNYCDVHEAAKGLYVAQIDGDDYILPEKLKTQVEILESQPKVTFCAHALKIHGTKKVMGNEPGLPLRASIDDLVRLGTYFGSSSVMYRRQDDWNPPNGHENDIVDFSFHLQRAAVGEIYLDKRIFGVYRKHSNGISRIDSYAFKVQRCYEDAYDLALELGVKHRLVQNARLRQRLQFAISRYLSNDKKSYRKFINIEQSEKKYASYPHKFLASISAIPSAAFIYITVKSLKHRFVLLISIVISIVKNLNGALDIKR